MNPYQPPNQQSYAEEEQDSAISNVADHPLYPLILKMLLWGDDRTEVYERMMVNGISGALADRLYENARADRIKTIRGAYARKLITGIILLFAAVVVFSLCWFGLRVVPRILVSACLLAFGVGAWKLIDGTSGYLMAGNQKGSVTDEV